MLHILTIIFTVIGIWTVAAYIIALFIARWLHRLTQPVEQPPFGRKPVNGGSVGGLPIHKVEIDQ